MTTTEIVSLVGAGSAFFVAVVLPLLKSSDGFKGRKLDNTESMQKYIQEQLAKRDEKIDDLYMKLEESEKERDTWRDRYYEQLSVNQQLSVKVTQLQELVAKNAGIVQDNANNVSDAMDTAKKEINNI